MFQAKVAEKIKKKTHFLFSNIPPPPQNRADYGQMWKKNIVQPDRPQVAIWRMRMAC